MSVKISKNENGNVVTPFAGNPEFGYLVLKSTEMVFQNGWMQPKKRSTIMRGKTSDLQGAFTEGQELPGKIVVTECTADAIPPSLQSQLNKKKTGAEQLEPFLKRAGDNGPVLTIEGKQILRFTSYDPSGSLADARVAHDNVAEVVAHNKAQASGEAKLPK